MMYGNCHLLSFMAEAYNVLNPAFPAIFVFSLQTGPAISYKLTERVRIVSVV